MKCDNRLKHISKNSNFSRFKVDGYTAETNRGDHFRNVLQLYS